MVDANNEMRLQIAATQLLVRSLISCLVNKESEGNTLSIEDLLATIRRRSAQGRAAALSRITSLDSDIVALLDELEAGIKREATMLVADLSATRNGPMN